MYKALFVGIAAVAAVVLLLGSGPRPVEAATTVYVTSNADSGPGTFRDAIDQANNNSNVGTIKFLVGGPITLLSSVEYDNTQPLTLSGRLGRTVIQGSMVTSTDVDIAGCYKSGLFESNNGADISLINLVFQNNNCGNGVYIFVADEEGSINVLLNNVILRDNDRNGLYVRESDYGCDYSDASVNVTMLYSSATGNDENGVRIREYGEGSLTTNVSFSQFRGNGYAGLLAAEHCDGDFALSALSSVFSGNSEDGLLAEETGDGQATMNLTALDASQNGWDGVTFSEDDEAEEESLQSVAHTDEDPPVDDGPEATTCTGDDLVLTVSGGRANNNGDDGIDIDEDDCGSLRASFATFAANENSDDGIDLDEAGGGDLVVTATGVQTSNNGHTDEDGNGIQLSECGYGSINANLSGFTANGNGSTEGSGDGIDIDEEHKGNVSLTVKYGTILSNLDDGVDAEENGCGNLTAAFSNSGVNLNVDDGFELYQDDCGGDTGSLTVTASTVFGNGGGNFDLGGVVLN